jgi:hypothetical protein
MARYHRIDSWRGFWMPDGAIAGASDTGTWSDSPCPTPQVKAELRAFAKYIRSRGIPCRMRIGVSSNIFCAKRYVVVAKADYERALPIAREWLELNRHQTRFIHDCEGDDFKKQAA